MRLDRFLHEMKMGSRSQVKALIRQGAVTVNGIPAAAADLKVDESADEIVCRGKCLRYQRFSYYMLNKPEGVVSARSDAKAQTVLSLLGDDGKGDIAPVGRLDKDTTGLLLLTDDGELTHSLLSPKKHVDKTYRVSVEHPLSEADILRLEQGVDIGDEKPTLPARVEIAEKLVIFLTIREGRFHQVKRMLQAVDNRVTALQRVSFGSLTLDKGLAPGEYRELTREEIDRLKGCRTED